MASALTRSVPIHSLRSRLTVSYILLLSVVMAATGLIIRQVLQQTVRQQAERLLTEEWGALLAYLRIDERGVHWEIDPDDPDQASTLQRLQGLLLVADSRGEIIEISNGYRALGAEQPVLLRDAIRSPQPRFLERQEPGGERYLIRVGRHREKGQDYAVALGMPVPDSDSLPGQFTRIYFSVAPLLLLAVGLLGWFAARRALEPLKWLAEAASTVSEGNLSHRIPPARGDDEVGQLVATFNRMMDRLEANFHQIRQFTIDASHELRTPLTGVRGQLEVALLNASTPEQYREAIVAALQDVEKLSRIMKTLVQLARAESGQVALRKTREDMAEIARHVASMFEISAGEKAIRLECRLPETCPLDLDRALVEQLMYQLLSNAVNFTPQGGLVKITLHEEPGEVRLSVSDTGPGIPKEHVDRIFERFYRVRNAKTNAASGAGLGLPLAAWVAAAHGGRIEVQTKEGAGSVFAVCLPRDGETT